MGEFIAQKLQGKGRVVEIRGLEGSSPALERHRGFMEAMKKCPGMQVVASEAGDWKEESGKKAMQRILDKTRDFDYVFSHNDRMGWGAYQVVRDRGLARNYKFTGMDAMATRNGGLELVRDGIFEASYLYPTKGDEVVALAMRILRHQPFKRENYLRTSIITKDNALLTLMQAKDAEHQQSNLESLHKVVNQYVSDYHDQKLMIIFLVIMLFVIFVAAVLVFRNYLIKIKLTEQLSSQNKEMKRLNEEVMELTHSRLVFFTNISHELRTPLTLIADPVEMLLDDEGIKGKTRDLLKMVQRNALALQQLVGSILDFRKIQNGKMNLTLNRFDIVKALELWTGDFQLTAERKQIRLHFDGNGLSGDTHVIADKEKVSRIVFNLLSNALKYTPSDGDIFVSLKDAANKDFLRIDVRDTGKGIAKDEAAKVFERFFQAKGAASGTGIGLALVKSFVDLHHGVVYVESEFGKGSDFKGDLARALVFEALARCLHNQPRGTRLRGMRDARLQQEGFGGRQFGRACLDAVVELNARIKSGSMTARKLGLVGENAAQIKAAGRLTLGACKGADLHLTRRVPIKDICHHGERATNITHNHRGKINIVIDLGNVGHGAIGDCRKQVLALKRTALADKQRARTHLARVISCKLNALVVRSARSGNNKVIFLEQLYIAHQS